MNSRNIVNVLLAMCCLQYNDTPLDLAIERNNINIVNYFITQLHQDISKIKQVCNC